MEELATAQAAILADARAQVAAGREPNVASLATRIATAVRGARFTGDPAAVDEFEAAARRKLGAIVSIGRARAHLGRDPAPREKSPPPRGRRLALRTKPTITGSLNVRRAEGEGYRLVW